eukprot:6185742-Pleurochrysis_carterae.AAC.1
MEDERSARRETDAQSNKLRCNDCFAEICGCKSMRGGTCHEAGNAFLSENVGKGRFDTDGSARLRSRREAALVTDSKVASDTMHIQDICSRKSCGALGERP